MGWGDSSLTICYLLPLRYALKVGGYKLTSPYTGKQIMFTQHLPKTLVIAILLSIVTAIPVFAQKTETAKPAGVPVIWRDPGNISQRNLTFGPGASDMAPVAPFTFIKEELTGE